ncbi:MAG: ROK family protein [Candidatus Nanohaloarchaea archaeon]
MAFVCVDVGGTNTLIGVGNGEFEIKDRLKTKEFLSDPQERIRDIIRSSSHSDSEVEKLAVAVAGPMDREKGVFYPPNIQEMDEVQIVEPMEALGDVTILNDCTSAVAGEYFYGEKKCDNMVYLTISSGIGTGAVVDGEIVEGWNGNAGEVGHIIVGTEGVTCGCGGTDHWEAYCSGEGMPEMAREVFGEDYESSIEIFRASEDGESSAEKVIEKMQECNSAGFANVVNVFNPEVIWIGGAVALNHFSTVVEETLEEAGRQTANEMPEFRKCSLEDEAVIHGLRAACNGMFEV